LTRITSTKLRDSAFRLLQSDVAAAFKLHSIRSNGLLPILNFHRISDRDVGSGYTSMTPALFDEAIVWLGERFELTLFGELPELRRSRKPPLIISFDDGYKDFIETVVPILEKRRVRVNQNIIPAVVESGLPPMNVLVQDFIAGAPASLLREIRLPGLPGGVDPEQRQKACLAVSAAIKSKPMSQQRALYASLKTEMARFDSFRPTPMMSTEDLRQIASVHELGAHSYEHASMASEGDDYLSADATKCKEYFSGQLGQDVTIYAFPNGSWKSHQAELLRGFGFKHVLLVGEDYSRPDAWLHPRFTIHGQNAAEVRARALGWIRRHTHAAAG
jgi:peptidoglycan/xylan/chitin deacetylase (PgdA/CDA1 family)